MTTNLDKEFLEQRIMELEEQLECAFERLMEQDCELAEKETEIAELLHGGGCPCGRPSERVGSLCEPCVERMSLQYAGGDA